MEKKEMAVSLRALENEGLGLKTMAETLESNDHQHDLKPFYQRASAAEVCSP